MLVSLTRAAVHCAKTHKYINAEVKREEMQSRRGHHHPCEGLFHCIQTRKTVRVKSSKQHITQTLPTTVDKSF